MAYAEPDPVDEAGLERSLEGKEVAPVEPDRQARVEAAVGMKAAGASYAEIARVLGYSSAHRARVAVERGLADVAGPEDKQQLRFLTSRRLERLLRGLWNKATDENSPEHLAAARTALAVIDRHARLYGIDAPQEMVVYNPSGVEIDAWVSKMVAQVRPELPEEADIIDAEVVTDE